jgi:hypothetical protein
MPVKTKHLNGTLIREMTAAQAGPAFWSPAGRWAGGHYLWPGPPGGLYAVTSEGITPVTHPAASGRYCRLKDARGALARLLAVSAASLASAAVRG